MTRRIEANYGETYLFPPSVEEWVGAEHPARFIQAVVEELDLGELGLSQRGEWGEDEGQGRPHYSDELLLKAWLYGYLNEVRSARRLERACRDNVGLIWLLGRHEPDHNTLWRFWRRHREGIRKVFRQVVRIASQAQVVGAVLHAVDGTKIQARASTRRSKKWNRQQLAKQVHEIAEEHRIAVRSVRQHSNNDLKKMLHDKEVSEDNERIGLDEVQKLTNEFVAQIDELSKKKEEEILTV